MNLLEINNRIADRSGVFYWQTDRRISVAEAAEIWKDKHRGINSDDIIRVANETMSDKIVSIAPVDPGHQNNEGSVNSVRDAVLESGRSVIIRIHPKGVRNGYFYTESLAAKRVRESGLPAYETLIVHESTGEDDSSFQVIEKLPGLTVSGWLKQNPADEAVLVHAVGATLANIHKIKCDGFGPFDNERAKAGELVGLNATFADSVRVALDSNFSELLRYGILTPAQVDDLRRLFDKGNPLLQSDESVLVHNDLADWNCMTDNGKRISGIIDFDECVAGNPVMDIACWSTFFEPERMENFLAGYFSVAPKMENFDELFELLRLRYTISKMTLRANRYEYMPTDFTKSRIEAGKKHLAVSFAHFKIRG
ncbi:MAG: aminoglycoside phosphotransferase family protein [Alphaproteobacteria bacterium]|nr:aminoglycoside phosphotransferase family protein [Alphaproteobacteria bacterium]